MDERQEEAVPGTSGLPQPPWHRPRRPPARAPLTREAIVDAAIRVLDARGMDGLSMRRVGEELGTGAGSLYWHVRNKDELFQLIFERVTEQMVLPEPDPSRWKEQLRDLAHQMRARLKSHRDVARLSLGRVPIGPALAVAEWLFRLLEPVGIPDRVIAYTGDVFGLYVGAHAFEESLGMSSPTGEAMPPEEIAAMFRDYALSLPEDRFSHARAAADLLFGGGPDERYEFGIDLMVRGLESYARRATGPST
jgi:TetR/AcrR family transcriptional regulator, tetracycline repressor protein